MSNDDIDLVFKLETDNHQSISFLWSANGGITWNRYWAWNDFDKMIATQVNRFIVDCILKPNLKGNEYLCSICRNNARVGIMRFNRQISGTEKQARVWYEGDVEVSGDVSFGVNYRIDRCDNCGNEESDYA